MSKSRNMKGNAKGERKEILLRHLQNAEQHALLTGMPRSPFPSERIKYRCLSPITIYSITISSGKYCELPNSSALPHGFVSSAVELRGVVDDRETWPLFPQVLNLHLNTRANLATLTLIYLKCFQSRGSRIYLRFLYYHLLRGIRG
jgi:hypothetical protein